MTRMARLGFALAIACAIALPALAQGSKRIVAFGDSTTATRGPLPVYAQLLQQELPGVEVINAGVGGNTTEMARARFDRDVLARQPGTVIIQFGINDSAVDVWKQPPATGPRVAPERFAENLRYFAQTLQKREVRVILMTPNPLRWAAKTRAHYGKPPYKPDDPDGFNVLLNGYAETVRQVARDEQAGLIDVQAAFRTFGQQPGESVDRLLLDGMHPNAAGQRLVADLLLKELRPQGAKNNP